MAPILIIDGIKVVSSWNNISPTTNNIILTAIFEGYYNSITNVMSLTDTAKVYLRNSTFPYAIVDSAKGTIDRISLNGMFHFSQLINGNYYLVVKQRNTIETWSKLPLTFNTGLTSTYNFTTSVTKAFGDNMKFFDGVAGIFSGDVNQDGYVNLNDIILIYNNSSNFVTGYVVTDLNGDNITNLSDILLAYNNSNIFVSVKRP